MIINSIQKILFGQSTLVNKGTETLPSPTKWLNHGTQHRTHCHAKHKAEHVQGDGPDSLLAGSEHVGSNAISGILQGATRGSGDGSADYQCCEIPGQGLGDQEDGEERVGDLDCQLLSQYAGPDEIPDIRLSFHKSP